MKTYEITSKTTANGLKYGAILRDGDKVIKVIKIEKSEVDAKIKELTAAGYQEHVDDIIKAFREYSDGSGNLTEEQVGIIDKLYGNPDIGYNIRQYREGAGLTQTELAEIIGVGQARVADWENNKVEPKASSIIALAKALQVDPGTLLE